MWGMTKMVPACRLDLSVGNFSEGGAPDRFWDEAQALRAAAPSLAFGNQTYLQTWSAGAINHFRNIMRISPALRLDPSAPNSRATVVPPLRAWHGDIPLGLQPNPQRPSPWMRRLSGGYPGGGMM